MLRIGVLGCGRIAETLSNTFNAMDSVEAYAVASRDAKKAEEFAKKYGYKRSYGSYEDLVKDGDVDLVYVATPHSRHYEDMRLCIENGRPVICEKSFTINAKEARKIAELAWEKNVYTAEAIWTRYMPSRKLINDVIESGVIGDIDMLTANLSYPISDKKRIVDPELAGGALLDVGVYGINFAMMCFGNDITDIDSFVEMTDSGVDGRESISIHFAEGRIAVLTHSIYSRSDRQGVLYGNKGYAIIENINNPQSIRIYDTEDNLKEEIKVPPQISGYEYEFLEAAERIEAGENESASMPLDESIRVMEVMDRLRKTWDLVYPKEK